jgi:hypothetical protein
MPRTAWKTSERVLGHRSDLALGAAKRNLLRKNGLSVTVSGRQVEPRTVSRNRQSIAGASSNAPRALYSTECAVIPDSLDQK